MNTPNSEKTANKEERLKREIHPVILAGFIINFLLLSMHEYIGLKEESAAAFISYVSVGLNFVSFIAISVLMATRAKELICLYFLVDNILGAFLMAAVGIIGFSYISANENPTEMLVPILVISSFQTIVLFLGIGAFRILILNVEWKAYQVVLMKICFLICSLLFTTLACDLIVNNWASDALKDFIFLYLFGMVTTFLEMYGKFTDFDGTAEMRFDYSTKKDEKE